MQKVRKVKGTNDLFGKEILAHNLIEEHFIRACKSFNFKQISTPILEHSDVFTRSLGSTSDIVSKEMYNFVDQGNDSLVLRPEGTAAIARAIITNSLEQDVNKLFIMAMFRRESLNGRLRQFHQVGVEYLGQQNHFQDLEILLIAEKFLHELGIRNKVKLELNSLGNEKTRKEYNKALTDFLSQRVNELSDINEKVEKKSNESFRLKRSARQGCC